MSALGSISTRLVYSEDQVLLRDEARRFLGARASIARTREWTADARGDDPAVWSELAGGGWLGLAIGEEHGGSGLGVVDLVSLVEESGRVLLPTPLLGHLLVAAIVDAAGSPAERAAWLPRLAAGDLRATWAPVEPSGMWRVQDTSVVESDGLLSGSKSFVWAADSADLFCLPVRGKEGLRIALVLREATGIASETEEVLDRTRRQGRLCLTGTAPTALLERPAPEVEETLLPLAWTALAAESVGGASAALDMTASYAATREQFGKAIGSFQAIKHPLVNVLIAVEHARSLVYAAACAIDQDSGDAPLLARMAKAAADEAYGFATSRAIQFHGGFGFTDECDAHLYRRRALASRPAFGDPDHHRAQIADVILNASTA